MYKPRKSNLLFSFLSLNEALLETETEKERQTEKQTGRQTDGQ